MLKILSKAGVALAGLSLLELDALFFEVRYASQVHRVSHGPLSTLISLLLRLARIFLLESYSDQSFSKCPNLLQV